LAEGSVGALTGLQMATAEGRAHIVDQLSAAAQAARAVTPFGRVHAGVTGFDGDAAAALQALFAQALGVASANVHAVSDIELICRSAFAPGGGHVVYAGTGSIAAHLDVHAVLHRAGGRGSALDDAGSGYWITREALRHIWRGEDEEPGCWQRSPMAQALFAHIGGSAWADSRRFINQSDRGTVGAAALVVASAAEADPVARNILQRAGAELARLASALLHRLGPMPLAQAGRAFELHPLIESTLRQALPVDVPVSRLNAAAHHTAAHWAAGTE
jgi:N-acetylglucosamine kinase-like BadF-type ATPase